MTPEVIFTGVVVAVTEFVKRAAGKLGFKISGELTIVVAAAVGFIIGFIGVEGVNGISPTLGAVLGAFSAGSVRIVEAVKK